jgi:hypothetical protein
VRALFGSSLILAASLAAGVFAEEPTPAAPPPAPPPADMSGHFMGAGPMLTIRGFSNVDFAIHDEGQPDTFTIGQFDLLITSAISDDISVLAEVAMEMSNAETSVDVERMQLKWAPATEFSLSAGRMHTPFGYWNQTYHHGTWFQTTESRPEMYLFEDDGGILPIHGVGLEAAGVWHTRSVDFKYNASVLNGRGPNSADVVHEQDATNNKAVNLWLAVSPAAVPGLEAGGSGYFDQIPPDGTVRLEDLRERIFTAYAAYVHSGVELIAEASRIEHKQKDGVTFDTDAGYAQASVRYRRCRPYYRFDLVDVADGDPYLPAKDLKIHTLGVRVDPTAWLALKGEYHLFREHGEDTNAARFQVAFTF